MKGDSKSKESQSNVAKRQDKTVKQTQKKVKRNLVFQRILPQLPLQTESEENKKRKERVSNEKVVSNQCTKPEKLDSEIEEIARTIKEANDKKMVQIRNYPIFHNSQTTGMQAATETLSEDWTSIQGQFGWAEIDNTTIPYLTRSGQKYVSLRMVEAKVFLKYKQVFSEEILNCFHIDKLLVTKAEATLLNEINFRHSDNLFGRLEFTTNDAITTLNNIQEMHEFLEFCYTRLVEKNMTPHIKCGFIRIASQNFVPYVWYNDRQYVPLFYFEGECKYLEDRSTELRGWELAYLKLACKIQGIRKAFFDSDSIRVVEMDLVKKFFPPETPFEWMWPAKCKVDSLLYKPILRIVPVDAQAQNKSTPPALANSQQLTNEKRMYEKKSSSIQKKSVPQTLYPSIQNRPSAPMAYNGLRPSSTQVSMNCAPPQRPTFPNQYVTSMAQSFPSTTYASGTGGQYQRPGVVYVNRTSYPSSNVTSNVAPNVTPSVATNISLNVALNVAPNVMAYKQTSMLRSVSVSSTSCSKLLQIPDFTCNVSADCPYFLVKTQVEDKQLNCINMEPYLTTILLVTLEEVAAEFFQVALDPLVKAIYVMRLDIFLPNKLQIRYLERSNRYSTVGLIKYKDFIDNIPQIRYILSSA